MKCKYCHTEIEQDAQFCPNCGKDLSKISRCFKCGELLDKDTTFCPYCGVEQPHYEEDSGSRKWVWVIAVVAIIIFLGGGYWYYTQTLDSNQLVEAVDTDNKGVQSNDLTFFELHGKVKECDCVLCGIQLHLVFDKSGNLLSVNGRTNYFVDSEEEMHEGWPYSDIMLMRDKNGKLVGWITCESEKYTWSNNRVISGKRSGESEGDCYDIEYSYDDKGNRTKITYSNELYGEYEETISNIYRYEIKYKEWDNNSNWLLRNVDCTNHSRSVVESLAPYPLGIESRKIIYFP